MDKAGETTDVDGVSGGCGGEAIATFLFEFPSEPPPTVRVWALALSSAKASQKALCVMKLSLLHSPMHQPQSK